MSVDDGFTNIRIGRTDYHVAAVHKVSRPSSQATTATEASDSSSSESAPATPAPAVATSRLPAWKLREAAKASGTPKRSTSNSTTGRPPRMTMEVGTQSGHRRVLATTNKTCDTALPYLQGEEGENEVETETRSVRAPSISRRAARTASRDSTTRSASSRDPATRISSTSSSRETSRRIRGASRESHGNRTGPTNCSAPKEPARRRTSSREPCRPRSSSREPRRLVQSTEEIPSTPSTVRTATVRGTRRAMRKSDVMQNDDAIPSMFRSPISSAPAPPIHPMTNKRLEEEPDNFKAVKMRIEDETPQKPPLERELSTMSCGAKAFPSTFSFDNDDPFKTSCHLVLVKPEILPPKEMHEHASSKSGTDVPPPKRKISKTPKSSTGDADDDLSCVPSLFRAAMDHGSKSKKASKKSSSKSKKEGKDDFSPKSPIKLKKKKMTKTSDLDSPTKTKKPKKTIQRSRTSSKEKDEKETEPRAKLPDGFDWEIPITPVFETPVSHATKKKLRSKEDILANSRDNSEAFHNSLDNLFELPADLLSPTTGKIKMDENTMPIIAFSDDASHASDMSSIHSISEYSDMDGHDELEPSTPVTRAKARVCATSGDRSVCSHRSGASRLTAGTRGTRNSRSSNGTTATAWQLREQQKHIRRPGGRRAHSLQAPNTAPARTRRAMTTHLQHQKIPLPPAFSMLSAPSTPKTPAMSRRLMSNKERQWRDLESNSRRGNIADSLLYFAGQDDEMSIEPDLLSQCSQSIYSTRSQQLKRFNNKPADQRLAIPKNATLETNPATGKQQLVVDLGDLPAAFQASLRSIKKK